MTKVEFIAIGDHSINGYTTFSCIEDIKIDKNKSYEIVVVAVESNKATEGFAACARLYALGYKSILVQIKTANNLPSTNVHGIEVISHHCTEKALQKAIDKVLKTSNKNVLDSVYGLELASILLKQPTFEMAKTIIESTFKEQWNIVLAGAELSFSIAASDELESKNSPLNNLLINSIFALPIFLVIIYCILILSMVIGSKIQQIFLYYTDFIATGLEHHVNQSFIIFYKSIIGGIETVLSFIPMIFLIYICLAFLERSGYMARAIRMLDKIANKIGLSGGMFIPMIAGFGCNVPAIVTASTLKDKKEQLLTVMMTPFIACSARLSVFAMLCNIFFETNAYNVVFLLYLIGILIAILTGMIFKTKCIIASPYISLPMLIFPDLPTLAVAAWNRTYEFITGAGRVIFILFVCIYLANAALGQEANKLNHDSILARISKTAAPVFKPIGLKENNWPAVAALATGVIAKESIIGTFRAAYSDQPAGISSIRNQFDGKLGVFCYLLFVLLYFPCLSVFITIAKYLNYRWAIFSAVWSNFVAYSVAAGTFSMGKFCIKHPLICIITLIIITICAIIKFSHLPFKDIHETSGN